MLSESKIRRLWSEAHNDTSDRMAYQVLAEMVEAEVRKQDDELIRQMLSTLEEASPYVTVAHEWKSSEWIAKRAHAIAAARARLGEKA